jgi:ribosomal protein S4E
VDTYKVQPENKDIESLIQLSPTKYTIKVEGGNVNSFGRMEIAKIQKSGKTEFWWGFSQQVNFKAPMNSG